jgi:heptaprenylglyceryl phosphate synthase
VRCLLVRDTSTYTPDKDHEFADDLTSLVEISVASYARQTVAAKAANHDTANDRVELDFDDIAFGSLESGQTVEALIFYVQTGGNDSSPEDDPLIAYIDTASGLPATLGGGAFNVTINAEGFMQLAQA